MGQVPIRTTVNAKSLSVNPELKLDLTVLNVHSTSLCASSLLFHTVIDIHLDLRV